MVGGCPWLGGHAWPGGMHGGGACMTLPPSRYYGHGIRSMSRWYASYLNAFLFNLVFHCGTHSVRPGNIV